VPQWENGEFEARWDAASCRALCDPRLSHAAARAFHCILTHANRSTGGWTLLAETIATETAMGIRHARHSIAELENSGYLQRILRRGQSNFYLIPLLDPGLRSPWGADSGVRGGGMRRGLRSPA